MNKSIALRSMALLTAAWGLSAAAQDTAVERWQAAPEVVLEASDLTLEEFEWIARPIIVFADSPADPAFRQQMEYLAERPEALVERDVVVIVDTDPSANSPIRKVLRPRGFQLTLIGKEGGVVLRKPFPWHIREITRSIDKQPIRRQELREK